MVIAALLLATMTITSPVTAKQGDPPSPGVSATDAVAMGIDNCGRVVGRYKSNGHPIKYKDEGCEMPLSAMGGGGNNGMFEPWYSLAGGPDPSSVAIGDFLGDSLLDVAMTSGGLLFLYEQVNGVLQAPLSLATPTMTRLESLTSGDYNGDGYLDLAAADFDSDTLVVWTRNPGGLFSQSYYIVGNGPDALATGDVNGDGKPDIVVSLWLEPNIGVLYNNGVGGFSPMTRVPSSSGGWDDIETGHLDSNNLLDIVKQDGQGGVTMNVYTQTVTHALTGPLNISTGAWLVDGIATANIIGDNDQIVLSYGGNSGKGISVWNLVGDQLIGIWDQETLDIPGSPQVSDTDQDGNLDVNLVHNGWDNYGLLRGNGDATFRPEELTNLPYASWYEPDGFAMGDICHNDGKPDAVVADYNHGLVVLCQATPQPDISIVPDVLRLNAQPGQIVTGTVQIQNLGPGDLNWHQTEGQVFPLWISAQPYSGTVTTGQSMTLTVTASTTNPIPYTYGASVLISSNDPDEPVRSIFVSFDVGYKLYLPLVQR